MNQPMAFEHILLRKYTTPIIKWPVGLGSDLGIGVTMLGTFRTAGNRGFLQLVI